LWNRRIVVPFAELQATLSVTKPDQRKRHMQVEIPEGAHIHIVVGNPARAFACHGLEPPGAVPALAGTGRAAPRLLLKSSLAVLLLAGSFALGHYSGATPTSELTRAAAEPAVDHPLSGAAPAEAAVQVPAEFQRQLQQQPWVTPPPRSPPPGASGQNPFGLEK
jgi:hypothetical protein